MGKAPIYVTQPLLPSLEQFIPYLENIWESKVLTNGGPFHQKLEKALAEYLGVEHLSLFTNGAMALVTALQSLRVSGDVITTPYSFVATAHALAWNGIRPIFVDVDPGTLNMDPARIEAAITPTTTAILPVHCYGHECDVEAIQRIADKYNLKVIYDAAHAFGVKDAGGSVLRHGDLSILSFHATKVFSTFEGGAIICPDAKSKVFIDRLKNFGFVDEVTVAMAGLNGKMSEIHAAFGLLLLDQIDGAIQRRGALDRRYRECLSKIPGIRFVEGGNEVVSNYSYFPILLDDTFPTTRDGLWQKLKENNIFARRYFYPLISDFSIYRGLPSSNASNLPQAKKGAEAVLCLPIYPALSDEDQQRVIDVIAGC